MKIPNKMLPTTIIAYFIKMQAKNSNYTNKVYNIYNNKIYYFIIYTI